ncbi:hypothetical protein [Sphingomonas paucimobilis]|uniref:Mor transcription activator domain-containing protein n=1 Tax=Sphingomonas paucimobilis TaxID=13689 RepID=A0A7T3E5I3_SPHPI|nr:hypothetical protein [Sphingomonas paucimobilis]QPT08605.1 hypothetical protein I6G38_18110 [Sphingomonas paucimobilis]
MTRDTARSEQIEDVIHVIGSKNFMKLCEALGGTNVYVPKVISPNNVIRAAIGEKAAGLLSEYFSSTVLRLPKAHTRRQKVIELALSGQMTVAEAALACDYSERRVYQLLAAQKKDDNQLDLFA